MDAALLIHSSVTMAVFVAVVAYTTSNVPRSGVESRRNSEAAGRLRSSDRGLPLPRVLGMA